MKFKLLCLALVLSGGLFGCATAKNHLQSANGQSIGDASKFTILQPWTNKTFTLLVASSGQPQVKSRVETITAKFAIYQLNDLKTSQGDFEQLWVAAIPNLITKKICFIDAERDIYIADKSGMTGSTSPAGGWMTCVKSYVEVPGSMDKLDAAVVEFEKQFNAQKFSDEYNYSIPIVPTAPDDFFGGPNGSAGGSTSGDKLNAIELMDGILRAEVISLPSQKRGIFWIDFKAQKVIKSIVDGQEMNLSHIKEEPFATPLKKGE